MKEILCIIGTAFILFSSCSESDENQQKIETGNVIGTVFDKETGEPRSGVNVCIGYKNINFQLESISSYVTGNDGMYSFENILPTLSHQSYTRIEYVWVQDGNAILASRGISVIAGRTVTADISY